MPYPRPTRSCAPGREPSPYHASASRSRDGGRAEERKQQYQQQRKEFEAEEEQKAQDRKRQREQELRRRQEEYEAEQARRDEKRKARAATFKRILANAPATFTAAQLRVLLRALVNLDAYTFADDLADDIAGDNDKEQRSAEEVLLSSGTPALAQSAGMRVLFR